MDKRANVLKVALVGVYPPPYGGVAIHVQRLQAECLNNNIRCTVFNTNRYVKKAQHVGKSRHSCSACPSSKKPNIL